MATRPDSTSTSPPQLLTRRQVAELLGVSDRKLYDLERLPQDPLRSILVGGRTRFELAEVTAWIARRPAPRHTGRARGRKRA
jgi:excisionase family DNA binding protein